jgi:hypothetical protein
MGKDQRNSVRFNHKDHAKAEAKLARQLAKKKLRPRKGR